MVTIALSERETMYAGWQCRWNYWGRLRAEYDHTHSTFREIPFVSCVEEDVLEKGLA